MNYDLRPCYADTKQKILETIQRFAGEHPEAKVTGLQLEFDIDPGLLCVHIDTRPAFDPGMAYQMPFVNYAELNQEAWGEFNAAIFEQHCHLITHLGDALDFRQAGDGTRYAISGENVERYRYEVEGDHFLQALGLMLVDVVTEIRDEGGFGLWQLSPAAVFCVDNIHGYFFQGDSTWPSLHPGASRRG